jgi:hypothetical protein
MYQAIKDNMSQNSYNLAPVDMTSNANTDANKYFNNFFSPTFTVNPDVDAAVISYFETVADNKGAAKILASAVMYTARTRGADPMAVLQEFMKLPKGEVNSYLTMFLNLQRKGTSLLGITTQPMTNKYVARSILP